MKVKEGVRLTGMQPQVLFALMVAKGLWDADGSELTVTSVNDGKHSHTSLHYAGCAVDIRTFDIENPADKAVALDKALGRDFDVIYEGTHIHVEYQPRRPL